MWVTHSLTKKQRYLGDDRFVEQVARRTESKHASPVRIELGEMEKIICRQFELSHAHVRFDEGEQEAVYGQP